MALLAPLYPTCTDGSALFTLHLATKWEAGGQPDEEGKLQAREKEARRDCLPFSVTFDMADSSTPMGTPPWEDVD